MLASFSVSGMLTNSLENSRKRSHSKTVDIIDEYSPRSKNLAETNRAKDYSENLEKLICGIQERDNDKIDAALKYWISDEDLRKALELLIQSAEKYDEKTKLIMDKLLNKGGVPNNHRSRIYNSWAIEAIRNRDSISLEWLLNSGLDPNAKDDQGRTLLQIVEDQIYRDISLLKNAQKYNYPLTSERQKDNAKKDLCMMNLLHQNKTYNEVGDTLLTDAIKNGKKFSTLLGNGDNIPPTPDKGLILRVTAISFLLDNGTNINATTENGLTPLMISTFMGELDIVKALVEKGADLNLKNNDGKTALMIATENSWIEIAQYLINNGANVHERSNYGETAFGIALSHRYKDIAVMLLKAMEYQVPLVEEVIYGQESVVDWCLQQKNVDVNMKGLDGMTLLMVTSETGDEGIAKYLLAAGADINAQDNNGKTALSIALSHGNNNITNLLLGAGAEVGEQDKFSLIDAAENGYKNIVKYCIENGFEVDEKGAYGVTPLMLASANGHKSIVRYLLVKDADFVLKEYYWGYNALMFAVENGRKDIIKILLNYVKDEEKKKNLIEFNKNSLPKIAVRSYVNSRDKFGNNPLMIAINQGHMYQNHREIIKILMNAGADVYCENKFGETPISVAEKYYSKAKGQSQIKWSEIIEILSEYISISYGQ